MPLLVRPAVPEDAPALHALNIAFNGDTAVTPQDVRRSLQTGTEIVLIALADGKPAGFCCAQVHHSFCYPAPAAELTEMYVAEAFRRRGCATEMLRQLAAMLRQEHGAAELHLLTGLDNHAAQEVYRRAGFLPHPEAYLVRRLT